MSLRVAVGADLGRLSEGACLEARNLGLAERAALAYFLELRFGSSCAWIVDQSHPADARTPPAGTRLVWQGSRPGDRNERFRLYKKS